MPPLPPRPTRTVPAGAHKPRLGGPDSDVARNTLLAPFVGAMGAELKRRFRDEASGEEVEFTGVVCDVDVAMHRVDAGGGGGKSSSSSSGAALTDEDVVVHVRFDDGDKEDMLLREFREQQEADLAVRLARERDPKAAVSVVRLPPSRAENIHDPTANTTQTQPQSNPNTTQPTRFTVLGEMGPSPNLLDLLRANMVRPGPDRLVAKYRTRNVTGELLPNGHVRCYGREFADPMLWVKAFKHAIGNTVDRMYRDWRSVLFRDEDGKDTTLAELFERWKTEHPAAAAAAGVSLTSSTVATTESAGKKTPKGSAAKRVKRGGPETTDGGPATTNQADALVVINDHADHHHDDDDDVDDNGSDSSSSSSTTSSSSSSTSSSRASLVVDAATTTTPTPTLASTTTTTTTPTKPCDACAQPQTPANPLLVCIACHSHLHPACSTPKLTRAPPLPARTSWICSSCSSSSSAAKYRRSRFIPPPDNDDAVPSSSSDMVRDAALRSASFPPLRSTTLRVSTASTKEPTAAQKLVLSHARHATSFLTARDAAAQKLLVVDRTADIALAPSTSATHAHPSALPRILGRSNAAAQARLAEDDARLDRVLTVESLTAAPLADNSKRYADHDEAAARAARSGWAINVQGSISRVAFAPPRDVETSPPAVSNVAHLAVALSAPSSRTRVIQLWRCSEAEAPTFQGGILLPPAHGPVAFLEWCPHGASELCLGLLAVASSTTLTVLAVPSAFLEATDAVPEELLGDEALLLDASQTHVMRFSFAAPVSTTEVGWAPSTPQSMRLYAAVGASGVFVWDVSTAAPDPSSGPHKHNNDNNNTPPSTILKPPAGTTNAPVLSVAWSGDDRDGLIALHEDGSLLAWDAGRSVVLFSLAVAPRTVAHPDLLVWPRGADYVVVSSSRGDGRVAIVQLVDGRALSLRAHFAAVTSLTVCPRLDPPVMCSTSADGMCLLWRLRAAYASAAHESSSSSATTTPPTRTRSLLTRPHAYACCMGGRITLVPGTSLADRAIVSWAREAVFPSSTDVVESDWADAAAKAAALARTRVSLVSSSWGCGGVDLFTSTRADQTDDDVGPHTPHRRFEWLAFAAGSDVGVVRVVRLFVDVM